MLLNLYLEVRESLGVCRAVTRWWCFCCDGSSGFAPPPTKENKVCLFLLTHLGQLQELRICSISNHCGTWVSTPPPAIFSLWWWQWWYKPGSAPLSCLHLRITTPLKGKFFPVGLGGVGRDPQIGKHWSRWIQIHWHRFLRVIEHEPGATVLPNSSERDEFRSHYFTLIHVLWKIICMSALM